MDDPNKIRMTSLAYCAGCAAKVERDVLGQVLRRIPHLEHPDVLGGYQTADDAGVYRISDDLALVQTVDFFPPIVDDPFTYGAIAAANSLSDIYAMGAKPLSALNILGFPRKKLSVEVVEIILRGAVEKAREADCPIIGGHSIDSPEPFFGLSVTGAVHPGRFITNGGGRPGDSLVLTKPIGTGILTTASKAGLISDELNGLAIEVMNTLNRAASEAMLAAGAHACTDVTGFGLLGHLHEMCRASGLGAEIIAADVPLIDPSVTQLAAEGITTQLSNFYQAAEFADYDSALPEELRIVLCDPQTSGGLLVAISQNKVGILLDALSDYKLQAAVIGNLVDDPQTRIKVK